MSQDETCNLFCQRLVLLAPRWSLLFSYRSQRKGTPEKKLGREQRTVSGSPVPTLVLGPSLDAGRHLDPFLQWRC